jgi:hypothetical protein
MFLFAMVLAATSYAPEQVLAGRSFEELASRTDAICPARKVRSITPGDLDYVQEGFEQHLSHRASARLKSANDADRRCAGRDGLSCPTVATLDAIKRANLMKNFESYICSHPNSR